MVALIYCIAKMLFYMFLVFAYGQFTHTTLAILEPQQYTIPLHDYIFLKAIISNVWIKWALISFCVYRIWGVVTEIQKNKKLGYF